MRVKLFFSLRRGNLILQARRPEDTRILQLVPRLILFDDFPNSLVDSCVHWLDLETGELEFRPVESPWTPDPANWRLTVHNVHNDDSPCTLRKISADSAAPIDLVDIRSPTCQMISALLFALETPKHIVVTCTNQVIQASLGRLRLVFFVNQNLELECRSMPGYVVDDVQSCGTMIGLKNKLVLRPSNRSSEMPRRVLIPHGDMWFELQGDFACVYINTSQRESARHVHWHEYTVDTDLGRLTGNVSLQSKLYQCYLHALTSHCLPDPLLGHTGTEESLNMLQSAAFLSFQRLGNDDAKLLRLISELTPRREYYPPFLKSTVAVEWNPLPALSQHHDFSPAVLSILAQAKKMEALYDKPNIFPVADRHASFLVRTAFRNKVYYPKDLQSPRRPSSSAVPKDVVYKSRDTATGQRAEHAAYQMSWSVWNDRPCLSRKWQKLWKALQSWKSIGPAKNEVSLRYSRYWLTFDAMKDWLGIYYI